MYSSRFIESIFSVFDSLRTEASRTGLWSGLRLDSGSGSGQG